ncbi:MAG: bacteriohemerythrin [Oscillospiraceae bacterium]
MWKESYRIGIDQIDQQHKQLVETLADLLAAIDDPSQDAKKNCALTIDFLKSYAVVHFNTEEAYQEKIRFAEAERHKALHDEFKTQLHTYELALIRSDYAREDIQALCSYLTKWWIYHIIKEDKKMGDAPKLVVL